MKKFHFSYGTVILILVAALGAVAWHLKQPVMVQTIHAVHGPAIQAVYATGTVESGVMLPISPRVMGRLMTMTVDEGSNVKKDDVLANLEDDDVLNALAELRARKQFAQTEYDRQNNIFKRGFGTKQAVDKAKSDLDAAAAGGKKAEAEAGYLQLKSPADGVIIRRDGEIGQIIPANQPVFWISCCAPLRITAEVDEEDIPLVRSGQKVLIRADSFPDKTFAGKVQSITPKGDEVARSFRVRIALDSQETPLLIGMTAESNIVTGEFGDSLLIPAEAVRENHKVWVAENGTVTEKEIKISVRGMDKVAIAEGLTEQDAIISGDYKDLLPGAKVRTVADNAQKP